MSCTIVTCYYRFPSKHTFEEYDAWMRNFLCNVDQNMVIYCEQDWVDRLQELRKEFAQKTHIIVLPWAEMRCAAETMLAYFRKDWARDHEQSYHNPLLYILWNEKTDMVRRAISTNPFSSEYFCWCDIGCFRKSEEMEMFQNWPSSNFLSTAYTDKMYMLNIHPFDEDDHVVLSNGLTRCFRHKTRIGGTIFLGHRNAWNAWHTAYYNTMDSYMRHDYFAGKDQNIMASVAVLYPSLVYLVEPSHNPCDGDPWFYLQRYFMECRR